MDEPQARQLAFLLFGQGWLSNQEEMVEGAKEFILWASRMVRRCGYDLPGLQRRSPEEADEDACADQAPAIVSGEGWSRCDGCGSPLNETALIVPELGTFCDESHARCYRSGVDRVGNPSWL